jgi:histidyl-tRNA synthetase
MTTLDRITRLAGGDNPDSARLADIMAMAQACGLGSKITLAPNITRGLDYYTGVVFETFLDAIPQIGSVCSGGRYNDLASLYTTQRLPGVGASVGIDRLIAALETTGKTRKTTGYTRAVVINIEEALAAEYQAAARTLRLSGIATEVFPDTRKTGQQFAYAETKGASHALVRGTGEKARGVWILRELATRTNVEYADVDDIAAAMSQVR